MPGFFTHLQCWECDARIEDFLILARVPSMDVVGIAGGSFEEPFCSEECAGDLPRVHTSDHQEAQVVGH